MPGIGTQGIHGAAQLFNFRLSHAVSIAQTAPTV